MRLTKLLVPTAKEVPSDATLKSHIFLIRGGFIQPVGGSGLYNFLPLGKIVLEKIKDVIKQELDRAGAQEVMLSFVTPSSLWEQSGRYEKYGKELLRFKDRKDNEFVLGPTHEEMMVNLVRQSVKSYRQLPLNLYQINLKFRDEIRPRFGLMRGREFVMKDGYSFHVDEKDMKREFDLMECTYKKIFERLGLDVRVVEADSGAIGGSGSKEFMVLAKSGEDTIVVCDGCEYGANIEAAKRVPKKQDVGDETDEKEVATPDLKSIDEVSRFFGVDADKCIKVVALKARYDNSTEKIVLFALSGDDDLQETKACSIIGANELVEVDENELEISGLFAGYMGPKSPNENVDVYFDERLAGAKNMICGANKKGYHIQGYTPSRDAVFVDIAEVKEGDECIKCGSKLRHTKGIEVGHIFQLGTRYSEPLGCDFLDSNGRSKPMVMGTYGIGVSRLLAAIIEQKHDEKGCIWSKESAPFEFSIILADPKNEKASLFAENIYKELTQNYSKDVLFDDRTKERFGAKMKDFELMGIPFAIIVGKGVDEGKIELLKRENGLKHNIVFPEFGANSSEIAQLILQISDL